MLFPLSSSASHSWSKQDQGPILEEGEGMLISYTHIYSSASFVSLVLGITNKVHVLIYVVAFLMLLRDCVLHDKFVALCIIALLC